MSFAGPPDPRLRDALARVAKKGVVLVAAAGNAGPQSPPLYPAADPNVIAVTATDSDDALFSGGSPKKKGPASVKQGIRKHIRRKHARG